MSDLITAYTKLDAIYPGYVNFSIEGEDVVVLVRGDPSVNEDASYVCGFAGRDKGKPGRCTPGDERCNNYCNMAPEKGPMQQYPAPCRQVYEGATVSLRLSKAEWAQILSALNKTSS